MKQQINTKYIYLSHIIDEKTPTYGNRDSFLSEAKSEISNGDSSNSSKWIFTTNHLGTHIDVPNHFISKGKKIDDYLADSWVFNKIQLINVPCTGAKLIDEEVRDYLFSEYVELIIIKTGFEYFRNQEIYWKNNPGLSHKLADYLKNKYPKLRAIGFDFISLTSFEFRDEGKKSHYSFLNSPRELLIIEDMMLKELQKDPEEVIILPVRIKNGNGAPVTIIAKL